MTITYELGNALYINITNRCSNRCSFCVRNNSQGVAAGIQLWLEREPAVAEVLADIRKRDINQYKEFVFCGYGEPMMRAFDVLEISRQLKDEFDKPVRINTNGHANLICGQDITPRLAGLIDAVSISMNAKNSQEYQQLCLPDYDEAAYPALLDFAGKCRQYVPEVTLSVVDVMPPADIAACRAIAEEIGVNFRVRQFQT
ncbi:TatD family nuclease-associated radical SAM protein [Sporomusa aerivorans]|uniref:TatD family nuclease-associated radical SAM protein n=1 Tax=Sporomusa aerivorans TaxID=204936 RepID=UPI00352B5082